MLLVARAGEAAKSGKKKTAAFYLFSIVSELSLIYNNTYSRTKIVQGTPHAGSRLAARAARSSALDERAAPATD